MTLSSKLGNESIDNWWPYGYSKKNLNQIIMKHFITGTNWSIFRSLGIPFVRLAIGICCDSEKKINSYLFEKYVVT